MLVANIYVDDIVFGATSPQMVKEFTEAMSSTFHMSMVGELHNFLGLKITQHFNGIFISQSKYARNVVKKFDMDGGKHAQIYMGTNEKFTKVVKRKEVDV